MLFSSFEFLFIFLPITAAVFFCLSKYVGHRAAIAWLVTASLFFYGWWKPAYLGLIAFSTLFNYGIGWKLGHGYKREGGAEKSRRSTAILIFGIAVNLAALGYFKYANFFVDNANYIFSTSIVLDKIILPLAISFFTFQQIAFLVDSRRGLTHEYNFLHYTLFVTFFPQLIAGPIVHHAQMLPQFAKDIIYKISYRNLAIGFSIIIIGLFKKVVLADGVAIYADRIFAAAEYGRDISFIEAWGGALAFTSQLYFDFSGYVDMATGAARIFGIILPLNFYSPYKAVNIIDFWRRWHMTLSQFLRDYLYITLGGNRKGKSRRYINLMITMLLGGLWHGAGWTFVFWGFLHGIYLVINHAWHAISRELGLAKDTPSRIGRLTSWAITFLAVVVAWVFFRAESFSGATVLITSMLGKGMMALPDSLAGNLGSIEDMLRGLGFTFTKSIIVELDQWKTGAPLILASLLIAVLLPNSNQLFEDEYSGRFISWKPNLVWLGILSMIFVISILILFRVSPFLYFNF